MDLVHQFETQKSNEKHPTSPTSSWVHTLPISLYAFQGPRQHHTLRIALAHGEPAASRAMEETTTAAVAFARKGGCRHREQADT